MSLAQHNRGAVKRPLLLISLALGLVALLLVVINGGEEPAEFDLSVPTIDGLSLIHI